MPRALVSALTALSALTLAVPAAAQPGENSDRMTVPTPPRQIYAIVFGDDPCPQASETEYVVCGRRPEAERYRVPRRFRENPNRPREMAWGARALDLENAQRDTRPNSCSVVGSFGQTGCTQMMIRQWWLERQADRAARSLVP